MLKARHLDRSVPRTGLLMAEQLGCCQLITTAGLEVDCGPVDVVTRNTAGVHGPCAPYLSLRWPACTKLSSTEDLFGNGPTHYWSCTHGKRCVIVCKLLKLRIVCLTFLAPTYAVSKCTQVPGYDESKMIICTRIGKRWPSIFL